MHFNTHARTLGGREAAADHRQDGLVAAAGEGLGAVAAGHHLPGFSLVDKNGTM